MEKDYNLYDKVVATALTEILRYTKDNEYMYFPMDWKYESLDGPFFLAITRIAQSMNHKPIVVEMPFFKFIKFKRKNKNLVLRREKNIDINSYLPLEKINNIIIEKFHCGSYILYNIYNEYYKDKENK